MKDPKKNAQAWDLVIAFAQDNATLGQTEQSLHSLLKKDYNEADWEPYLLKIQLVDPDDDGAEGHVLSEIQEATKAALRAIVNEPTIDHSSQQPSQLVQATSALESVVAQLKERCQIIGEPLSLSELLNPDELVESEAGRVGQVRVRVTWIAS
ncbi:hypothetical protein JCM1840_007625 [Sporobolomyces johnsonii]